MVLNNYNIRNLRCQYSGSSLLACVRLCHDSMQNKPLPLLAALACLWQVVLIPQCLQRFPFSIVLLLHYGSFSGLSPPSASPKFIRSKPADSSLCLSASLEIAAASTCIAFVSAVFALMFSSCAFLISASR